ncbi:hypothetical protein [Cupriavidus sp. BIC8F]|uniref:hypothetical protein n=1 Tax=Cupriavidus sp. BIC8F TaxID=3079014 RepID=UPI0029163C6B|nr:hypothetical protein [Cupriavidus sp. BIC8F]
MRTTEALFPKSAMVRSHYHGGCRFDFGGPVPKGTEVLETYADTDMFAPAVVAANVGRVVQAMLPHMLLGKCGSSVGMP